MKGFSVQKNIILAIVLASSLSLTACGGAASGGKIDKNTAIAL